MKVAWSDLNNVKEAGRYPFRDGVITVLEIEIAIWRSNPKAIFNLSERTRYEIKLNMFLGISDRPRKARLDQSGLHHLRKPNSGRGFSLDRRRRPPSR
jgi:hypothetical protein